MQNETRIKIPNSVLELSDLSVAIFLSMARYCEYMIGESLQLSIKQIPVELYGTTKILNGKMNDIKTALCELEMATILSINEDKQTLTVYKSGFNPLADEDQPDFFTLIDIDEFNTIMGYDGEYSNLRFKLLHLFALIISSINYKASYGSNYNFVGFMPHRYFAQKMMCSELTIGKYFRILENLELIYVCHCKYNWAKRQGETNKYGRYSSKKLIEGYVKENFVRDYYKDKRNEHHSFVMLYNRFKKFPDSFSRSQIVNLYERGINYNRDIDQMESYQPGQGYKDKKRDLSIFKDYIKED